MRTVFVTLFFQQTSTNKPIETLLFVLRKYSENKPSSIRRLLVLHPSCIISKVSDSITGLSNATLCSFPQTDTWVLGILRLFRSPRSLILNSRYAKIAPYPWREIVASDKNCFWNQYLDPGFPYTCKINAFNIGFWKRSMVTQHRNTMANSVVFVLWFSVL